MSSKKLLIFGLAGIMTIATAGTAFVQTTHAAAPSEYCYNIGKAIYGKRGNNGNNNVYSANGCHAGVQNCANKINALAENGIITAEQAEAVTAYLAENPCMRLDLNVLTGAGVIDQTTSDAIQEYACQKHNDIHCRYLDGNLGNTGCENNLRRHKGKNRYACIEE